MAVYSKAAVCNLQSGSLQKSSSLQLVKWWFIVKQQFTHVNYCFTKKNLKERCYLHSVQQSYEKNSCKPGIKYFTSVNCHFTVICQFTLVNCCFTVIRRFTKDHLLRTATFFILSGSAVTMLLLLLIITIIYRQLGSTILS